MSACHYFPAERVTDLDTSTNALHVPGSREREDFDLDLEEFASFVERNLPKRRAARPHWLRRLTLFRTSAATDAARL
ncbi:MAG: hypothetical protein PGN33_22605 [Methylobacterium radiotolerans]